MVNYDHTHRVAEHGDPTTLDLDAIGVNTKVILPDGEIDLRGDFVNGSGHMAFVAAEGADPTVVVPDNYNKLFINYSGSYFKWDGIDVKVGDNAAIGGMQIRCPFFDIRNKDIVGRALAPNEGEKMAMSLEVREPDPGRNEYQRYTDDPPPGAEDIDWGELKQQDDVDWPEYVEGRVENVTAKKGSTWARYSGGRIWMWVSSKTVGTLYVRNCDAREHGNNAIYASASQGPIVVEDCYFENNNVASVRFGSDGCVLRDSEIVLDPERYTGPREDEFEQSSFHHRGVWVEQKNGAKEGKGKGALNRPGHVTLENVTITVRGDENGEYPCGAKAINVRPNGGGLRVRDCDIRVEAEDVPAIRATKPRSTGHHPPADPPHDIDIRQTRAVARESVDAMVEVQDRDARLREGSCLFADAPETNGFVVHDGGTIRACEDSLINVTGDPVRPRDTDLSLVDTVTSPNLNVSWPPSGGITPSPGAGITPPTDESDSTPTSILRYTDTMELKVKTDGDGEMGYRLDLEDEASIEGSGDLEDNDELSDDRVKGRVSPGWEDTVELRGALTDVNFSGKGADGAFAELDGERVDGDDLVEATQTRVAVDLLREALGRLE